MFKSFKTYKSYQAISGSGEPSTVHDNDTFLSPSSNVNCEGNGDEMLGFTSGSGNKLQNYKGNVR